MRNARTLAVAWSLAIVATAVGCTSVLGDFTVAGGSGGAPEDGGGGDVNAPPADGGSDAAADAGGTDAAAPRLACTTWRYAQPQVLDDLSAIGGNSRTFNGEVFAWVPAQKATGFRVVAGQTRASFRIYDIDKSGAGMPSVAKVDGPAGPYLTQAKQFSLGFGSSVVAIVTQTYDPASNATGYDLYPFFDGNGPVQIPNPVRLLTPGAYSGVSGQFGLLPLTSSDWFVTAQYQKQAAPAVYALGIGRATYGTPAKLSDATTSATQDFQRLSLVRANSNVYAFGATDQSGAFVYALPESAVVSMPIPRRSLSGTTSIIFDVAPNLDATKTNISYAEVTLDPASGALQAIASRGGAIGNDRLDTFKANDLPLVKSYANLAAAPFGENRPVWFDNDFAAIGPGLDKNGPGDGGAAAGGLNFLWFDATGAVRDERSGLAALLRDRGPISRASLAPVERKAGSAVWDVTWIEPKTDDGGTYEVLYWNELICK